jgi:hypothetical protein
MEATGRTIDGGTVGRSLTRRSTTLRTHVTGKVGLPLEPPIRVWGATRAWAEKTGEP